MTMSTDTATPEFAWDAYDFEVVIPTIAEEVLTLESVPDEVPVTVEREGTLNEARNRGVRNADSEVVMIMDDDIAFPPELLRDLAEHAAPNTLIGLADWDYGWIAGRVMIFYRDMWEDVGGFDETLRSHMGDTEFALKALSNGYHLERLPRELFYHEDHERSITTRDHVWRLPYLCVKYPRYAPTLIRGMVL